MQTRVGFNNWYVCHGCGASKCKLWREYLTFADRTALLCCDCAAKRGGLDMSGIDDSGYWNGEFGETDQIGRFVPAVPTDDDTFWGYTSVPVDAAAWWRRLPTRPGGLAGGDPKRETQVAARVARTHAVAERLEAERPARIEIGDCRSVILATRTEQHHIWCRNAADAPRDEGPAKSRRIKWEHQDFGRAYTIGELAGFPICISVCFARLDGEPVAFVEATSRVVDHQMVDDWIAKNAKPGHRVADAMNWRNALR